MRTRNCLKEDDDTPKKENDLDGSVEDDMQAARWQGKRDLVALWQEFRIRFISERYDFNDMCEYPMVFNIGALALLTQGWTMYEYVFFICRHLHNLGAPL